MLEDSPIKDKISVEKSDYRCIWKDYIRLPVPLKLKINPIGSQNYFEYIIPANPDEEMYQLNDKKLFKPVVS